MYNSSNCSEHSLIWCVETSINFHTRNNNIYFAVPGSLSSWDSDETLVGDEEGYALNSRWDSTEDLNGKHLVD